MTRLTSLRPMLDVRDLNETIAFYRDRLGFRCTGSWGHDPEKPTWCELTRDNVGLMFTDTEPHDHDGEEHSHEPALGGSIYLNVDDVDALFEELKGKVDKFEWEPETMVYGMREIGLRDCNDFLLIFGMNTEPEGRDEDGKGSAQR